MKFPDIIFFRVEASCFWGNNYYRATDDDGGELHRFPGSMVLDVPQHFTAINGAMTAPDENGLQKIYQTGDNPEIQDFRQAYFDVVLPINANPALTEKQRLDETARIKANFKLYGTAEAPKAPEAPKTKAPEDMSKAELADALTEMKVEFDPKSKNADLVVLLVAAQAKAKEDEE